MTRECKSCILPAYMKYVNAELGSLGLGTGAVTIRFEPRKRGFSVVDYEICQKRDLPGEGYKALSQTTGDGRDEEPKISSADSIRRNAS